MILLKKDGEDMTKQPVKIKVELSADDSVIIKKEEHEVIKITTQTNNIDLKELYDNLNFSLSDNYIIDESTKKLEQPTKDSEKLFNNVIDFMKNVVTEISKIER